MTHQEFVQKLTEQVDRQGKALAEGQLKLLQELMKKSKGNIEVFKKLVSANKKTALAKMIMDSANSRSEVKKTAQEFRGA